MRFVALVLVLLCLSVVTVGFHFVHKQQQQLSAYSAQTTATVVKKRLKYHRRRHRRPGERSIAYEPVVEYRYEAEGQELTGERIFPHVYRIGGNLGRILAKAPLDRFEVGQQTAVFYDPGNPADACLIRRPSSLHYLVVLLPVLVASGIFAWFWRSPHSGGADFKRRKARWIAVVWHTVGLAAFVQYLSAAGVNYSGGALLLFGVYTQLGLVPVVFALPDRKTTAWAERVEAAAWGSLVGAFVGFWLGMVVGWLVLWISGSALASVRCMGFGIAIPALLLFVGGLCSGSVGDNATKRRKKKEKKKKSSPKHPSESRPTDEFETLPPPDGPVPYDVDQRPRPTGEDLEALLPKQVGPFRRSPLNESEDVRNRPIYALYRSNAGEVFVELGICDDPPGAQRGVDKARAETVAEFPGVDHQLCLDTEPSFFKAHTPLGGFFAWTRGGYYFSAHAKRGEDHLEQFMVKFPY